MRKLIVVMFAAAMLAGCNAVQKNDPVADAAADVLPSDAEFGELYRRSSDNAFMIRRETGSEWPNGNTFWILRSDPKSKGLVRFEHFNASDAGSALEVVPF